MNSHSVHKQAMPENPHGTSAEPIPLAIEGADKTESSSDGEGPVWWSSYSRKFPRESGL